MRSPRTAAAACAVAWVAVACAGPVTTVATPAPVVDEWHPPAVGDSCADAGAAAVGLLRDMGASVPRDVWEWSHANRLTGDPADVETFTASVAEAVAALGEAPAELAASTWPTGHVVESCTPGERADVWVYVGSDAGTVRTFAEVVWIDGAWHYVAPPGGSWSNVTEVVAVAS